MCKWCYALALWGKKSRVGLFLHGIAGFEGNGQFGRYELSLFARGVDDDAFLLLLHFEGAEALNGEGIAFFEGVGEKFHQAID